MTTGNVSEVKKQNEQYLAQAGEHTEIVVRGKRVQAFVWEPKALRRVLAAQPGNGWMYGIRKTMRSLR